MNALNRSVLCCLLLAAGCSKSEAPVPENGQQATVAGGPAAGALQADRSQIDWSSLPMAAEQSVQATPEQGATLQLADGTKVVLPPGAVNQQRKLTLRRLSDPGPTAAYNTLTQIELDGGDAELAAEAEVTLPCPTVRKSWTEIGVTYEVIHHHGSQVEKIPCVYDAARNLVTVRTRRFSGFEVFVAVTAVSVAVRTILEAQNPEGVYRTPKNSDKVLLDVPYYPQGGLQWCWAASIQMLLKSAGREVELWDLGRAVQAAPEDGLGITAAALGSYSQAVSKLGGTLEMSRLPWRDRIWMLCHVVDMLRQKKPVLICFANAQHVVVAVGFDGEGLYVHDPSGLLLKKLQPHWKDAGKFDETNALAAIRVPWPALLDFLKNQVLPLNMNYTATAGTVAGESMATVALDPLTSGQVEGNMAMLAASRRVVALGAVARYESLVYFQCDGRKDRGYYFKVGKDFDSGVFKYLPELMPEHPTRSDELLLTLHATYAAAGGTTMKVTAELGGPGETPLRPEATRDFSASGVPFVVDSTIPLFQRQRLQDGRRPAGEIPLSVKAEVAGKRVDGFSIVVPIGPSSVENLQVRESRGNRLRLTWNAVPEPDVEYLVWKVQDFNGAFHLTSVATTQEPHCETKRSGNPADKDYFCVQARHLDSKLTGCVAHFVDAKPRDLVLITPRFCKNPPVSGSPGWPKEDIPYHNALLEAGDDAAGLLGGLRYELGGHQGLGSALLDDLGKMRSELKDQLKDSRSLFGPFSIKNMTWLDENAGQRSWYLDVIQFQTNELCELAMSKDPHWAGNLKLKDLKSKEVGGVTTYRPHPPAPPQTANSGTAPDLNAALAGNRINSAYVMWRSGRYVFFLQRIILDTGEPAQVYDREYRMGENIIGAITHRFAQNGVGP